MAQTGSTRIDEVYDRQVAVGEAVERLRESGDAQLLAILESATANTARS